MHGNKGKEHPCRGRRKLTTNKTSWEILQGECFVTPIDLRLSGSDLLVWPVRCLPPSCPLVSLLSASLLRRKSQTAH